MVPERDEAKAAELSRLVLKSTAGGSYVAAMQLPEFGITLRFSVPKATEKQIAKATTALSASAR